MWKKLLYLLCVMTLLCGCGTNKVEQSTMSAAGNTITETKSEMSEEEKKQKEFEGYVYVAASNLSAYALALAPNAAVVSMDNYKYEMISDTMCKVTVTFKYEGHKEVLGAEATFDTTVDEWYMLSDKDGKTGLIGNVTYMLNGGPTSWGNFAWAFDDDLPD